MMLHMQGCEDIGVLDKVASELRLSMEAMEVNEEEALFEVGHSDRLRCMFAESQASSEHGVARTGLLSLNAIFTFLSAHSSEYHSDPQSQLQRWQRLVTWRLVCGLFA